MPMSYAASGQPAPASGTTAGFVFFKAMFDYMFSTYNTFESSTNTFVASAAVAATPSSIGKRDTLGAFSATAFAAIAVAGTSGGAKYLARAFSGTEVLWQGQNASAVQTSAIDSAGNGTLAGTLGVTGVATFAAPIVAPSISGTAAGVTAPVAVAATLSDYKAATNASAGTITIGAGGAFADSSGNQVGPLGAQTATLPTQPTGTNIQYVALSLAAATGAPVATPGVAGASPAKPTLPLGNFPVAMVTWRGATTLPSGVVAAGDIVDLRNIGGGSAGAGGGTGGAPTTGQYWINGTNGSLGSALDATNPLTNGYIAPALIRDRLAGASVADLLLPSSIPVAASKMLSFAGAAATLNPGSASLSFYIGGKFFKLTSAISGTATGGAGQRAILLDVTSGTPAITIATIAAGYNNLTQVPIGYAYYDGAGTLGTNLDDSPLTGYVRAIKPPLVAGPGSGGTVATTTYAALPGAPSITINLPTTMKLNVDYSGLLTVINATTAVNVVPWLSGSATGQFGNPTGAYQLPTGSQVTIGNHSEGIYAAGNYTVTLYALYAGTTGSTYNSAQLKIYAEPPNG